MEQFIVPNHKIPRPKNAGPRSRRRRQLGGETPRPGLWRRGTPPRLAGRRLATLPQWRLARRGEPRRFASALPRRPFQVSRKSGYWQRRSFREERRSYWQPPSVQRPCNRGFCTTPRRGPPVAAVKVSCWHRQELWKERRPRWSEPRGPLWGGPERSAGVPRRTPRCSLCGGPEMSSDDPRLSKTTQAKAKREAKGKKGESGQPSSRSTKTARKEREAVLPDRCIGSGMFLGDERRCQELSREER